jgi:putative transport protein
LGYAVAYPLGVVGIITALVLLRIVFKVNFEKENEKLKANDNSQLEKPEIQTLQVQNKSLKVKNCMI